MAARQKKLKGLTRDQLNKIWSNLTPEQWLDIANERKRDHDFNSRGPTLIGRCINPEHDDHNPSMTIHTEKKYAKCFGCGFYSRNPIELISLFLEASLADAVQYLLEHYAFKFLSSKLTVELENQKRCMLVKESIYAASHYAMCQAIADPTNPDFAFAQDALNWLINSRKVPKGILHALPVGILPGMAQLGDIVTDDYKKRLQAWNQNPTASAEPKNLADYATDYMAASYSNPEYNGSVLWPLHVSPTEIGRIKLRLPHDRNPKDILIPEDEYEDLLGLYGLGWDLYKPLLVTTDKINYAYLVEGEMDAMSLMAKFAEQGSAKYPIFSVGGRGGSAHIEPILTSSGIEKLFIIGDAPAKKGDQIVQGWLEKILRLETRIFTGYPNLSAPGIAAVGDLDDAVVQLGEEKVSEVIFGDTKNNFTTAWNWAVDQASAEIDPIDPEDIRSIVGKAAKHGNYVKNGLESEAYIDAIADKYDLNRHLLKREITATEPSEDGFIMKCAEALRDLMYVVGTEFTVNQRWLVCYSKKAKRFHRIKLNSEQSLAQELAPIVGSMYQFVKEYVGFPIFLETPENSEGLIRQKLDRQLSLYLRTALDELTRGAPDFAHAKQLKQGYHRVQIPRKEGTEAEYAEYIVCGLDVYWIDRTDGDAKYVLLEGPSHNNIIFDVGLTGKPSPPWYPGELTPAILNKAKDIDLLSTYNDLVKFFDVGFTFKHHDVMPQFLAGLMLALPVWDSFDHPIVLFITGDTHSGKSSLTQVFGSSARYPIRLLYHSHYTQDYSPASIADKCDRTSLLVALDESETDGYNAERVTATLEMIRPMINGETTRERLKSDGSRREQFLRMCVVMNAINGAKKPQDFNRLVIVEMKKIANKVAPHTAIRDAFTTARLDELARQTTTAMFPRVPELLANYDAIEKDYGNFSQFMPFEVPWRYASTLFPVLAVMQMIGLDWKSFYREFAMQNENLISRATTISESDSILSAMLVTAAIPVADRRGTKMCVGKLLSDPEQWEEINTSNCGVYFDKETKTLMFLLEQAMPQLLPPIYRYNMSSMRLKDTLERHRTALTQDEIAKSGIMRRAIPVFGAGIKQQDVVVVHADAWLQAASNTTVKEEKTETAATPKPVVAAAAVPDYNDFSGVDGEFNDRPGPPDEPNAG
jgi:hypothetical protein